MSDNFHTPYYDGVTRWKAEDMNAPLGELDQAITDIRDELSVSPEVQAYIIGFYYPGTPVDNQILMRHVFTSIAATFPSSMTGSKAICDTAPNAEVVLSIRNESDTEVGTITFAASSTSGVFSSSGFSCSEDDELYILCPSSMDTVIQNITISLKGSKDAVLTTTTV